MMMDYLKNAVAVVFVLNVANAGGIQNDRVFFYYVICVTQSVGLLIWVGVRSRASTVIKQCQFCHVAFIEHVDKKLFILYSFTEDMIRVKSMKEF